MDSNCDWGCHSCPLMNSSYGHHVPFLIITRQHNFNKILPLINFAKYSTAAVSYLTVGLDKEMKKLHKSLRGRQPYLQNLFQSKHISDKKVTHRMSKCAMFFSLFSFCCSNAVPPSNITIVNLV